MASTFQYSGQIRRFVTQFIRILSNFEVQFGRDRAGNTTLQRVPVYYGDSSRQVAQILKNNSENMMNSVPAMSVYISGLTYEQDRLQEPYHVGKMQIRQRMYNEATQQYETFQGDPLTVERLMPVPYKLGLKVDVWTSSTEQKLQLLEQLCLLFNPAMEIQNTDNYIDWTSLSSVRLSETSWSNRSIPVGAAEDIDVASLTFELPIWLSPPAKVKRMGVIHKIISSMYDSVGNLDAALFNDSVLLGPKQYFTPLNYDLIYVGNTLILLKPEDIAVDEFNANVAKSGTPDSWYSLVNVYGNLIAGSSQVRMTLPNESELIGTVSYHPVDANLLIFNPFIDTMPTNTITAINAIVDPETTTVTADILNPAAGTRYLILSDIGSTVNSSGPIAWKGTNNTDLIAFANDIIEYNGTTWSVNFDSANIANVEYVTNLSTTIQYKWQNGQWSKSVQGQYDRGNWSLVL